MTNDLDRLEELLAKATPGDLSTAEVVDEGLVTCPICDGEGDVEAKHFTNIDDKALGVQFYGIGTDFGVHEELWSALIKAAPDLITELRQLRETNQRLNEVVREAGEVLQPFAESANSWEPNDGDGALSPILIHPVHGNPDVPEPWTFGDLRAARTLHNKIKEIMG